MAQSDLIPIPDRTKEEQKRITTLGGIASGEARRRKRDLKALFESIRDERIEVKMPDGTRKATTFDEAAVIAMFQKAIRGDVRAMKLIATILGEYEQKVKVEGMNPVLVTEEERKALEKWANKNDD